MISAMIFPSPQAEPWGAAAGDVAALLRGELRGSISAESAVSGLGDHPFTIWLVVWNVSFQYVCVYIYIYVYIYTYILGIINHPN